MCLQGACRVSAGAPPSVFFMSWRHHFLSDLPIDYLGTLQGTLLYYELVKGSVKHLVVSHTSVGRGVVFRGTPPEALCHHDNVYLALAWEWFSTVISVCKQH